MRTMAPEFNAVPEFSSIGPNFSSIGPDFNIVGE
jgi:hypothetical protein